MIRKRDLDRVLRNFPVGRTPREFQAFVAAKPDVTINYTRPTDLEFLPSAAQELVPFIETGDGSVMALWFAVDPAAVVLIDAHGEPPRVLAIDFLNFLRAAAADSPTNSTMDEYCNGLTGLEVSDVSGKPVRTGLAGLQKQFIRWAKAHNALKEPDASPAGETLRSRIVARCKTMIADGLCKVYRNPSGDWNMDFRIARRRDRLQIEHLTTALGMLSQKNTSSLA